MNNTVLDGTIDDEVRRGWSMACPRCRNTIRYTVLNVTGGIEPFLYCDENSDFVLRDIDRERVARAVDEDTGPTIDQLRDVYRELETSLDPCPTGGRFRTWANVKCPDCLHEFPYNNGDRSEQIRYFDSKIVWVEGSTAYRGPGLSSNRLASVTT